MEQELFDKKYVYFLPNEELIGKVVFYADSVQTLRNMVNQNGLKELCESVINDDNYPFIIYSCGKYRFVYYDPNYEYKLAYRNGKKVEALCTDPEGDTYWREVLVPKWDDEVKYRIKKNELITYLELAEWLAKGNGVIFDPITNEVSTGLRFNRSFLVDKKVKDGFLARKFGDDKWHEPTRDYIKGVKC